MGNHVFVYGTLKRGYSNHHVMRFVDDEDGPPVMVSRFAVTLNSNFHLVPCSPNGGFPYMQEGGDKAVMGEVWSVGNKTLSHLDKFEGVPNHYRRQLISVLDMTTKEVRSCFTYLRTLPLTEDHKAQRFGVWKIDTNVVAWTGKSNSMPLSMTCNEGLSFGVFHGTFISYLAEFPQWMWGRYPTVEQLRRWWMESFSPYTAVHTYIVNG